MTTSMGEWTTDGPQMGEQWWRDTAIALRESARVERDARQAAERHADHWERMQANTFARWDAAEARVAALEAWITDHGWHLPPAVLGVQSTPTEPEGS